MIDLLGIKHRLADGGFTCILTDGIDIIECTERGVAPLLALVESGRDYSGYSAADKVVGKAAAFLYAYLGIKRLYADVISRGGLEVCERHGIEIVYDTVTDTIINRRGDGICPMEQAVSDVDTTDIDLALARIKDKREQMKSVGAGKEEKMKKIVLASGNPGKLAEFRAMLGGYEVLSPRELGITADVEETGATFYENALIKARALYELCKLPTMADDSGLCVIALDGAPGVFSARYSGGGDKENNNKLLKELEGKTDRRAYFESCIVYYDGKNTVSATGRTYGIISSEPKGTAGFGYDPLFISDDLGKTFGEATEAEKNAVSHRGRALGELAEKLGATRVSK